MTNNKTTNQKFLFIPLSDIEPSDYQREINSKQVSNIVANFDEAKLGTLTVSYRDGRFFIVDGAHRLSALRSLKFTHGLCEVISGLTREQEADYFRRQGQDKRALKPVDLFKAGIIAGDETCIKITEIVKANSFQIGFSHKDFYLIGAINALFAIVKDYGYEVLDETLRFISSTWAGIGKATSGSVLLGVAEFVDRFDVTDFDKRLCDKFSVVWYEYREAMRSSRYTHKARKYFCRILVDHYNKGLGSKSVKRLYWEG